MTLLQDEALAELTKRYFTSHGPATVQDFSWWSGLTVGEVKKGLNLAKEQLVCEVVNGQEYWQIAPTLPAGELAPTVHLLPYYDEYVVAYKDRRAILDEEHKVELGNGIFNPVVVVDGKLAGTWQRKIMKNSVDITTKLLFPLSDVHCQKLAEKVQEYAAFLELPAQFQIE